MRSLKILRCCNFLSLRDRDIVAIANSFSSLEELDISYPYYKLVSKAYPRLSKFMVTDAGIETLSLKLLALRKVDISRNGGCSDRSLIALSSNCVFLDEIRCTACPVTGEGLGFVVLHSPNLMSLKAGDFFLSPDSSSRYPIGEARNRGGDDLYRKEDDGFSLHGLSTFLCACPSLKQLELWYTYFVNDHSMRELCRYLPNVVSIKLFRCENLTHATFYIIAKQSPMVSEIVLEPIGEIGDEFVMDLESNDRITSVDLSFNWCLTDELLEKVGVFCPNLRTLNIRGCNLLTIEVIGEVLKVCSQIKHLTLGTKHRQLEIFLKEFNNRHIKVECW
ncbi:hypothetical protein Vadar_034495 [Vaccinium darrowii]|uniref:Uncharacterized protein n=1 Tax=Vaccinium darrowii TaxID=229202 RepID=A0ACB7ZPG0_9ERIC|nr:hypothetical protein Vadar_034495 [Vaccinium darrowii]